MRCPACLAEAIGSGKFCASCGTRMVPAVEAPPPAHAAAPAPPAPLPPALADTPPLANPAHAHDPTDMAFCATDAPPAVQETVDPFASTANPSDGALRAAAASASMAADAGRVSPLASSSFDLGSDPSPMSRGPLPAAGNPPARHSVEASGPMSASAPRSKHGSTVLLSAMPARGAAPAPKAAAPAQAPLPASAPAQVAVAHPQQVAQAIHAPPPASGYVQSPPSRIAAAGPPSSIATHGILPGARVIVTFPNGQRVFGTIWQCAQAHYLVQFPDGKSQWVETALVRSV